ncbi:BTB and MATH domain-containing protein 42 isoform X1 [Parasteatoda tepidariorum]|uniref:BTB and MATH domain-containing protein 42 isoform X1 n=1 Tax=Parasteatoda tepidariorum TaxID=114398 RepID=UPI001C727169|nr:uncharacterized protein LOC107438407 isoform X1 [Parasteatoda tepidariorum]XP_015906182.2 uncharacterized protein LOC107438407 isoform X1 [Parasteatoda tepidariorum]
MAASTRLKNEYKGITCYWRIENFTWTPGNKISIYCSPFRIESLRSQWQIEIRDEEECLKTYLHKITNDSSTKLDVTLSLYTRSGWIVIFDKMEMEFKSGLRGRGFEFLSFEEIEIQRKLYIYQGALTLVFRIFNNQMANETSLCLLFSQMSGKYCQHGPPQIFSTLKSNCLLPFPPSFEFQINSLTNQTQKPKEVKTQLTQTDEIVDFKDKDELLQMFTEKQFNFVTLCTPNKKFFLHKAVLCAKSPVFKAMFDKNMIENEYNSVDIDDIDTETMTSFIKFLHFEPIGDLSQESAVLLYYAADKYQIDSLKKKCVSILAEGLSVENVCDIFVLADSHQDKELMSYAQEYFCKNSKFIFLSQHWKDLIMSHPELIAEILYKSAQNM